MLGRSTRDPQRYLFLVAAVSAMTLLICGNGVAVQENATAPDPPAAVKPWVAPADARNVKTPVPVTLQGLAEATKLFQENCVICHGEKGQGDGESAKTLNR